MRAIVTLLACVLAVARVAAAPVDCSDPNNLCTGDPCVIDNVEPADPCVVDFGPREVRIGGLKNVRNVDFTAANFLVLGAINGGVGNGGHFSLTATTGSIQTDGAMNFIGGGSPAGLGDNAIRLTAAGFIAIEKSIRLIESPIGGGSAGEFRLDAGASLFVRAPIYSLEGAGPFNLIAGEDVAVIAPIKNVQSGFVGNFANLTIQSGGTVTIDSPVFFVDGTIAIQAGAVIAVHDSVKTRGPAITLDAQGDIGTGGVVAATGRAGNSQGCGGVSLVSHAGAVSITKPVICSGRFGSLGVTIGADADVTIDATVKAPVRYNPGGPIAISSTSGSVTINGKLDTRGQSIGGDIQVSGPSVQVNVARADSRPGGARQSYDATAGDLMLDGSFLALDGGTIEGTATGNVTAAGTFRVGATGCIALSAGGNVDASAASFDQTVGTSCP